MRCSVNGHRASMRSRRRRRMCCRRRNHALWRSSVAGIHYRSCRCRKRSRLVHRRPRRRWHQHTRCYTRFRRLQNRVLSRRQVRSIVTCDLRSDETTCIAICLVISSPAHHRMVHWRRLESPVTRYIGGIQALSRTWSRQNRWKFMLRTESIWWSVER